MNDLTKTSDTFKRVLEKCPNLTFVGEKVLREKTSEVTLEEGLKIGEKLKETLIAYRAITGYGRGLAAPQIGEGKSVFVTFVSDSFQLYLNPKIIARSTQQNFYRESCLSCGFMSADVKRSKSITLEYTNEKGEKQSVEADEFLARLLQHEYDHTQGIINIDIAEPGSIEIISNDPMKEKLREG